MLDVLGIVLDKLWLLFRSQRRLRLTVHRAYFLPHGPECFFVNATNLSDSREIEITHIWFEGHPQIAVLHADRPLPKRLRPDETWETWIAVEAVPDPDHEQVYSRARARLSNGKVVRSAKNKQVPYTGTIPGGPINKM
jgi:hypothetical protein